MKKSPSLLVISRAEHLRLIASRLYFSKCYRIAYAVMITSSFIAIAWTIGNKCRIPKSPVFISLEIMMSALLIFEVVIRMLAQKKNFWSRWCNVFDMVVAVLSMASIFVYFHEESVLEELGEVATDSLLAVRNAIQYIRLVFFLRNRQKTNLENQDIDFEGIYIPDHEKTEEETLRMLDDIVDEKNIDRKPPLSSQNQPFN